MFLSLVISAPLELLHTQIQEILIKMLFFMLCVYVNIEKVHCYQYQLSICKIWALKTSLRPQLESILLVDMNK